MMTDKCNLRCKHCFIFNEQVFHPVSRKQELNAEQYVQIFQSLLRTRTGRNYNIHITGGGEVFARPDFEEIMKQLALLKVPAPASNRN
jgi:MoaA/NifB/PqqE/SkfB family radical SAM enzyme